MEKFDLGDEASRKLISNAFFDAANTFQAALNEKISDIHLILNIPILNTAIDMARETVGYHGIDESLVCSEKKYAHICYWMLKLHPVSFVRGRVHLIMGGKPAIVLENGDAVGSADSADANTVVSYFMFLTLYCNDVFYKKPSAERRKIIKKMFDNDFSEEVRKSLRFHNYSSRAMAMFLEALMREKLA